MTKRLILTVTFLMIFMFSYSQEKLYKESGKTQLLTADEYSMLKQVKLKKLEDYGVKLDEIMVDSSICKNTLVYTYKLERVFPSGARISFNTRKEKIYSLFGKKLPDFNLVSLEGDRVKLSDYKGKPILINFWSTSCKPCIKEMSRLNEIRKKYGDKVVFLSITFNTKEQLNPFFTSNKFDFLHLVNAKEFISEIGISGYPKNILINRDGNVHQILGAILQKIDKEGKVVEGEGKELIREIEKII